MSRKHSVSRRARLESLESRQLLAGDVAVSVVAGNLVIQGDDLDNQIAVTTGGELGKYMVTGLGGTQVHLAEHAPGSSVMVDGVQRGARIAMGAGNDTLALNNVGFRGNVEIRMDGGNDQVLIGIPPMSATNLTLTAPDGMDGDQTPREPHSVRIGGTLAIGTGEGNDRVRVGDASIRGSLNVETGADDDGVVLGSPPPAVQPTPTAVTPPVDGTMPPPRPALQVGRGIHVGLGDGQDMLAVNHVAAHAGLIAEGGLGEDTFGLRHSRLGHLLTIDGGGGEGATHVEVDHVGADLAAIVTGAGHDSVRIVDSLFGVLGVALGNGDDSLELHRNKAELALFEGGDGQDTLLGLADNQFTHKSVHGFELPPMGGV